MPRQIAAARVGDDQLHSRLRGVLDPGRGHGMIHRGVGANQENHFGIRDVAHLVRHRARVDAFHQRRHARRVAQARAVVDVVGAEAGAHQLLEQVRLFVGAFGGAETGQRPLAVRIAGLTKSLGRNVERFFPGGLAEDILPVFGIDHEVLGLRDARLADQRLGQAMLVLHVVETVAPFHAQAARVRGAVLAPARRGSCCP